MRTLPEPERARWQPLRAGLVDLFYYDVEEFWFRDGRLLLRGNNGAGKSKVLALTVPFLLDGDLSAHRVEPDADPKKRMEWNLLLGGAHPHPERVGYTWLEFGRRTDDGAEFYTIGCGLKAVAGKGIAAHWYFVSTERIGRGLSLIDPHGTPLTRDRLGEELGDAGRRFDRARDYRIAVDEKLFGLGEQRYGALVDLLIRLRQPQLSKRPSEKALSAALTESLPPLGQAVLADVAEAFRSLQEDRTELAEMQEALGAAQTFLHQYQRYARVASRRRAEAPRLVHSKYEHIGRQLADADRALAEARTAGTAARAKADEVEDERVRLTAHQDALRESETMDAARDLDGARTDAERLTQAADRREAEHAEAVRAVGERQRRHEQAATTLASAESALTGTRDDAGTAAAGARLAGRHVDRVDSRVGGDIDPAEFRRIVADIAESQRGAIRRVRNLIDTLDRREQDCRLARTRVDELDGRAAELAEQRAAADAAVAIEAAALVAAARAHQSTAVELRIPEPDTVLEELLAWAESLGGDNPFSAAARRFAADAAAGIARADAAAEVTEAGLRTVLDGLADEVRRLESGGVQTPPDRHTLDPELRASGTGAPLWRVVDFAPDLPDDVRASVEAALEASGMLDAWLTEHGELVGADLTVSGRDRASGVALGSVLRPAIDLEDAATASIDIATVAGVLGAIGYGADSTHHTWVAPDGRFRAGALDGRWHKAEAQYVGAGAREQARRRRLAELGAEIDTRRAELAAVTETRQQLRERRGVLDAELADLPAESAIRAAHQAVATIQQQQAQTVRQRDRAAGQLEQALAAREQARTELDRDAADAALPTDPDELTLIADHLAEYRVATERLCSALAAARTARDRVAEQREELDTAQERSAELEQAATEERRAAVGAAQRFRTLQDGVGAEVEELLRALGRVEQDLARNKDDRAAVDAERELAVAAEARAAERQRQLGIRRDEAVAVRDGAVEALRRFAETGLLRLAVPDLSIPDTEEAWAPNPAVQLARSVEAALLDTDYDDKVWDRLQRQVTDEHKQLADVLSRQGNSTSAAPRDDGIVVDVLFRGKTATVPDLVATLADEASERSRLLSEREREILENHLVSEVASSLQELIFAAESQVAQMNAQLDSRPTSTGMRLRLQWEPSADAPAGAEAALRLLRRTADVWNEADRTAVGEFLQLEIERVRADKPGGTWLDHLTEALDYRSWNRFVIRRHQHGQWRPATGPASGGEGALVASVPLFAAAAAHYGSAGNPDAPRLITLDEAFAGVDDDARAKYLGLLAAFDLDVVMTSEREWGCYPEVPGLAIAQLARVDGVNAVLVTNWEWDGRAITRVDRPHPELVAAPDTDAAGTNAVGTNTAAGRDDSDRSNGESQAGLWN